LIWLASFPRSGNTFFRIVLHKVYGIESSTYHQETDYPVADDYDTYPIVKTHLLPHQLEPSSPDIPAVYLVRDGRDALVSMAHHRKDLIAPGSEFYSNLREAILAEEGSFFGGWSQNVLKWMDRAAIVIKFEELIKNPIKCTERLRSIMDLPEPDFDKLPSFNDLKTKEMPYGSGREHNLSPEKIAKRQEIFFRRGKIGGWKEEMPEILHELFWELHGHAMVELGYKKWTIPDIFAMLFSKHYFQGYIKIWDRLKRKFLLKRPKQ